ncbi:MAG: adenosylcobinamide-phosphate synthase CbiB [Pseudomonadota bacterium]
MMFTWLMLSALAIEAAMGWPDWLDRRIGHPVRWFGWVVSGLERAVNRDALSRLTLIMLGGIVTALLVTLAGSLGWAITWVLPEDAFGFLINAMIASTLVATRSLHDHVRAVRDAFSPEDLGPARTALSRIVGRETADLEEAAISRAAIESLAENTSDGVIAPVFWGVIFGLPGLFAYKAINTLDSMIGHRNQRYEAFGKIAARLDDFANLIPARLTGLLFVSNSRSLEALKVMFRDARSHRSPNAGWPEAAMAGALGVRLSGPRTYGDTTTQDSWLNGEARDPMVTDLSKALWHYRLAMLGLFIGLVIIGVAL